MKHDIIKTEDYLFVVDDSEIKEGDWYYHLVRKTIYNTFEKADYIVNNTKYQNFKKIIAHLPLNNSPILEGVDLLPPLEQEDEVERLAEYSSEVQEATYTTQHKITYKHGFEDGYNKAKEKYKYTEEDMRKAIITTRQRTEIVGSVDVEAILQSLSQPKMPIGFECEENMFFATNAFSSDITLTSEGLQDTLLKGIKTTTNSQGHTQWVGTYIYK